VNELVEKKIFSCKECGKSFDAYPPDDIYTIASIEKKEGSIERSYNCTGMTAHKNTIYWTKIKHKAAIVKSSKSKR
jgi:hypothetical protein